MKEPGLDGRHRDINPFKRRASPGQGAACNCADLPEMHCSGRAIRGLQPVEPALDVSLPRCSEVLPAELIQPTHRRLGACVEIP